MNVVHIVGRQNHGKTTLIADLIGELSRSGGRYGTIKHSSHSHELDHPGKDSFRHRKAGAVPAAIVTADLIGIYLPRSSADFYERLAPLFADCHLVLVEGHIDGPGPKVEVWRAEVGGPCLASQRDDIVAVISDDCPDVPVPVWARSSVGHLAQELSRLASGSPIDRKR